MIAPDAPTDFPDETVRRQPEPGEEPGHRRLNRPHRRLGTVGATEHRADLRTDLPQPVEPRTERVAEPSERRAGTVHRPADRFWVHPQQVGRHEPADPVPRVELLGR